MAIGKYSRTLASAREWLGFFFAPQPFLSWLQMPMVRMGRALEPWSASRAGRVAVLNWQELPQATHKSLRLLDLRFGPVCGTPVQIEPVTASVSDLRAESGELLGVGVTLPWLVP